MSQGWCKGLGTWGNPYKLENITIDGQYTTTCISIINSRAYFIVKNCTTYNAKWIVAQAGIELINACNGTLINNKCFNNNNGIALKNCNNISIVDNILNSNFDRGINIYDNSQYNTVSRNKVNFNNDTGIYIDSCKNNIVSDNEASNNKYSGIHLWGCNNTILSRNTAKFNIVYGIVLEVSNFNTVSYNIANENGIGINIYYSDFNTVSNNEVIGNTENCILEEGDSVGNIYNNNYCGTESDTEKDSDDTKPFSLVLTLLIVLGAILLTTGIVVKVYRQKKKTISYKRIKKENKLISRRY